MFDCWLTISGKILSSSKEATHSYQGIANFGFLSLHQNLSKSISETKFCAKMNIKGLEINRNGKGRAEVNLWTKVHGSSETRWHRFLSATQDIPVTYPVTVTSSPHLPPLSPTTQNSKRRGRGGDFLAI
jgi:hypothetical protein